MGVAVTALLMFLPPHVCAGAVCGELGQRTPGGGVVTHVYVSLGELPAVLVAASLLLDLVMLPALGRCQSYATR